MQTYTLDYLHSLTRSELAELYEKWFGLNGKEWDYNTLVAALFYGKRKKHLTQEEIKSLTKDTREQYLESALKDVRKGMDFVRFHEKYSHRTHYDSDDYLTLKNIIRW